jgi:rod shape-determining protein MreC
MVKNQSKKIYSFLIIIFLILPIYFILSGKGYLNPIYNVISKVFLLGSSDTREGTINTKNFFTTLFSIENILTENENLKKFELEAETLKKENEELKSQVEALKKELELLPTDKFELVNAEVISHDPNLTEELVIINKGSKQGIEKDMAVIIEDRILVGKIFEVKPNTSKILLSVSPKCKFDASLNDKDIVGVAEGKFNLEILLTMIPSDIEIEENEIVVTSGKKNQKFPEGLLVGKVIEVEPSQDKLFNQAVLKPFYSVNDLKFVAIIKDKKED